MFNTAHQVGAISKIAIIRAFNVTLTQNSGLPNTTFTYNTPGLVIMIGRSGGPLEQLKIVSGKQGLYIPRGFVHRHAGYYEIGIPNNFLSIKPLRTLRGLSPSSVQPLACYYFKSRAEMPLRREA